MSRNSENRGGSHRMARVEREIREVIGTYLIAGFRGDLPGIVSISRVVLSGDMRTAKVLFTMMASPGAAELGDLKAVKKEAVHELQSHAHEFQAEVNRKLRMRFVPKLSFHYDEGFDNALRVENILRDIGKKREEDEKRAAGAQSGPVGGRGVPDSDSDDSGSDSDEVESKNNGRGDDE